MKKICLIIIVLLMFVSISDATTDTCLWVWNVDPGAVGSPDAPAEVYCSLGGDSWKSMGATYIQKSGNDASVTATFDNVVADGVSTSITVLATDNSSGLGTSTTIPDNVNVQDLRVLGSANCSTFDAGGSYYYTDSDLPVDDSRTFVLTAPNCFKLQLETSTDTGAGGAVVWTTTKW